MTIELDHVIVSARDQRVSARRLADILGVPWAKTGPGPFSPVYVNDGLTLDFIDDAGPFPVQHFCFRVSDGEFDAILRRIEARGIGYRSTVRGPEDRQVNTLHGGRIVYWKSPTAINGNCSRSVTRGNGHDELHGRQARTRACAWVRSYR